MPASQATTGHRLPPSPDVSPHRWWILAVVVAAQFMFILDAFIVNVALPSIRRDLDASQGELEGVIAIYQIAYAAVVVLGGRLGDIFGRRKLFVTGVLAFTVASLWCGIARSGGELVLARMAQGGAAALMVPQVLATIHVLFPDAARTRAFAIFGTALGLGGAAGFLLGGWLVAIDPTGFGWRSVFLVNLPVGIAIALGGLWLVPATRRDAAQQLDVPGALLVLVALLLLVGPLLAGHELGWPLWLWGLLPVGALTLLAFGAYERRVERRGGQPLVTLALLRDRLFMRGLATIFSFQLGNIGFYLLVTLFLQGERGYTPMQAALIVLPLALTFVVASQLSPRWTARAGIKVLISGCVMQGLGLVVLAAAAAAPSLAVLMGALAIFGFGQGLVLAPLTGLVLTTVPPHHAGAGAGLIAMIQQASGALGVSLVGLLYFGGGTEHARGFLASLAFALATLTMTAILLESRRRSTARLRR